MKTTIAQFIISLAGATIGAWLASYFKKKGENKALKEDLATLTEIVKGTEKKFIDQTEELKAKLNLANQLEFNLRNEARNALIDIYKKIQAHYNLLSNSELLVKDFEDWREFDKAIDNCDSAYGELEDCLSLIELFIPDDEIGEELKSEIDKVLLTLVVQHKVFMNAAREFRNNILDNKKRNTDLFYSKMREISAEYDEEILEFENQIGPQLRNVTISVRKYLKSQSL